MTTYYAISGIGWGQGETPEQAVTNYVATQLRNYDAKQTIYKTRPKWKTALTDGAAKADVWLAPDEADGFVIDHRGLQWTSEAAPGGILRAAELSDKLD